MSKALTYAARNGHIEAMEFLLTRGADIDADPCNGTALHWALVCKQAAAAAWLIAHGATSPAA